MDGEGRGAPFAADDTKSVSGAESNARETRWRSPKVSYHSITPLARFSFRLIPLSLISGYEHREPSRARIRTRENDMRERAKVVCWADLRRASGKTPRASARVFWLLPGLYICS